MYERVLPDVVSGIKIPVWRKRNAAKASRKNTVVDQAALSSENGDVTPSRLNLDYDRFRL